MGEITPKDRLLNILYWRWFDPSWYSYLFGPRQKYNDTPWLTVVRCRFKGHPRGTIYYNPGGFEPDDHCKDCYEEI